MATPRIDFGYCPPTGDRGIETVNPATFPRDLERALDRARSHFTSFWVSDHLQLGDKYRLECWTQLTWLAARYPDQRLGTIVMANSYRHPPLLAKMAASLQTFSGGRLILGYGAGWWEEEYHAYGYPFPPTRVRIAQMVEGIQVMRAMWSGGPVSFTGEHYQIRDAYCEPRPEPPPPILIGGDGEKYLLRAVAEHADWWLPYGRTVEVLRHKLDVLAGHCAAVGRDPATIRKIYQMLVFLDEDRAAAERRAAPLQAMRPDPVFAGEPGELRDWFMALNALGFDLFVLVFPAFPATTDMELFAERVLPAFR